MDVPAGEVCPTDSSPCIAAISPWVRLKPSPRFSSTGDFASGARSVVEVVTRDGNHTLPTPVTVPAQR